MYHPRFKGNHYDIGLKLGKKLKKKSIDFGSLIDLNNFQRNFGKQSQNVLSTIFPEVCEEIRGLTDGLNYAYEEFCHVVIMHGLLL